MTVRVSRPYHNLAPRAVGILSVSMRISGELILCSWLHGHRTETPNSHTNPFYNLFLFTQGSGSQHVVPGPESVWKLGRNANSLALLQICRVRNSGSGPSNLFDKPFRGLWQTFKFENHWGHSSELPLLVINPLTQGRGFPSKEMLQGGTYLMAYWFWVGVHRLWPMGQTLPVPCFCK